LLNSKDLHIFSSELESRLDDLFREDEVPQPDSRQTSQIQGYPLAELKSLVLSIDWEITDDVLVNFLQQVNKLRLRYQEDKIIRTFLQILSALGTYIRKNRSRAHPKTFKILNSVFGRLDEMMLSKDMSEQEKKRMLQTEIQRYNELRSQVGRSKAAGLQKRKIAPVVSEKLGFIKTKKAAQALAADPSQQQWPVAKETLSKADRHQTVSVQALAEAVEEIKKYIHAEIQAIKEEMQLLRNQK
jgi:hypothetical protein